MNLDTITIQIRPAERESLAVALRAVARTMTVDLDYDVLCAALGISLVAVACPSEDSPAVWLTCARDAFLVPTARAFGMQLRDLHPPDVGVDMLHAEEYPQHFELSYKPLIRRALENGQPVIAWGGWKDETVPLWGVITASNGEDLLGVVAGSTGQIRLARPALQCYVVEQYERQTPSPEAILALMVAHTDAYLNRPEALFQHRVSGPGATPRPTTNGRPPFTTGPSTYDHWARWLEVQRPGSSDDPAREAYRAYACSLCSARLSAIRFLQRFDSVQSPDQGALLDLIASACEDLVADLCPLCRAEEVFTFWSTAEGHQELLETIRAAQAADRQIATHIHRLATTSQFAPNVS